MRERMYERDREREREGGMEEKSNLTRIFPALHMCLRLANAGPLVIMCTFKIA